MPGQGKIVRGWGRALSLALCGAILTFGCGESEHANGPADPPNVVLIVVDTLRADHFGTYGFDQAPTSPHLDALAEKSIVFDRAVAASTLTAPSHASMMTSRFVREHSIPERAPLGLLVRMTSIGGAENAA